MAGRQLVTGKTRGMRHRVALLTTESLVSEIPEKPRPGVACTRMDDC
jgi:hypothetical protein